MKKFTLLLLAILMMTTSIYATVAEQKVAYNGNYVFTEAWGGSGSQISISSNAFAGVTEGQMLLVKGTGTIQLHDASTWANMIQVEMTSEGTTMVLTNDQASYLANGVTIQSINDGAKLNQISFGDAIYTDTELLTSDVATYDWTLDKAGEMAEGNKLIFTFKGTDSSEAFMFAISKTDEDGWPCIPEANWIYYNATTESQTKTITITNEMKTHSLQARGSNITYTSIVYRSAKTINYTYNFVDGQSNVVVSNISGSGNFNLTGRSYDNYWNTLILPFDCPVTVFDVTDNPGRSFYEFKEYNTTDGLVFVERTPTMLKAGTPYLVNFNGKAPTDIIVENVTFTSTIDPATSGDFTFNGNYENGLDMEGKYGIAWSSSDNQTKFRKGASGTSLKAFRAYFSTIGSLSARDLSFSFENETTGIVRPATKQEKQTIFNLMGIQMPKAQKGLNIVNGSKVIIK